MCIRDSAKGVRNKNTDLKSVSMADWLAKVYKSDVLRGLVSLVFIIQIFYIAGQLSAGGTLLSGKMCIRDRSFNYSFGSIRLNDAR